MIFWDGSSADQIIDAITVPETAGHLEPADSKFNGPSGRSLDDHFLGPLALTRKDTWLCDLVPHTADFDGYGRIHPVKIANQSYLVLPLAHPRQASGLGTYSEEWRRRHDAWKSKVAPTLL